MPELHTEIQTINNQTLCDKKARELIKAINLQNESNGSITTKTDDIDVAHGLNVSNGAYSAVFGRYLENHAGYSLLSGYDNENYGRDSILGGYGNINGIAPDFSKLTEEGRVQYESTGWTASMSMYGLNSTGFANDVYGKDLSTGEKGDKVVFDPEKGTKNIVSGLHNKVLAIRSIVSGRDVYLNNTEIMNVLAIGSDTTVNSLLKDSALIGSGLKVNNTFKGYQTIIGSYNDPSATGAIFLIADGLDDENRSNAFAVEHTGRTRMYKGALVDGTLTATEIIVTNNLKSNRNFINGGATITEGKTNSFSSGNDNTIKGNSASTLGTGLIAYPYYKAQTVVGQYNKQLSQPMFIVGGGENTNSRFNALEVYKDGYAVVGRSTTATDSNLTLTTKDYVETLVKEDHTYRTDDDLGQFTIWTFGKNGVNYNACIQGLDLSVNLNGDSLVFGHPVYYTQYKGDGIFYTGRQGETRLDFDNGSFMFAGKIEIMPQDPLQSLMLSNERIVLCNEQNSCFFTGGEAPQMGIRRGHDNHMSGSGEEDALTIYTNKISRSEIVEAYTDEYGWTEWEYPDYDYIFPDCSGTIATREWVNENTKSSSNKTAYMHIFKLLDDNTPTSYYRVYLLMNTAEKQGFNAFKNYDISDEVSFLVSGWDYDNGTLNNIEIHQSVMDNQMINYCIKTLNGVFEINEENFTLISEEIV